MRTIFVAGLLVFLFSSFGTASTQLTELVKKIQPAVVKIVVYDMNKRVSGIGSGFFINQKGHLITNFHVLDGAFSAEVIARDGGKYPIDLMIAQDRHADLIKVSVDIPHILVQWLNVVDAVPGIAEQVLVVGNPLGLDQSVSEGIVSATKNRNSRRNSAGRGFSSASTVNSRKPCRITKMPLKKIPPTSWHGMV